MIARISIEPDSLRELSERNARARNLHKVLTRLLRDFGVIEVAKPDSFALLSTIDDLDPQSQELWMKTLGALEQVGRLLVTDATDGLHEACGQLSRGVGALSDVDLIGVCGENARALDLPDDGYGPVDQGLEASLLESLPYCASVEALERQVREPNYSKGTPRDTIWQERFQPLVAVADSIVIRDKFLLKWWPAKGAKGIQHLDWLLQKFDETASASTSVTIFAGDFGKDHDAALADLGDYMSGTKFNRRRPGKLHLYLVAKEVAEGGVPQVFKFHDRYIRFGSWAALAPEEGFDRLSGSKVWGSDGLTLRRLFTDVSGNSQEQGELHRRVQQERQLVASASWQWPPSPNAGRE